jgi:hypothetical protein
MEATCSSGMSVDFQGTTWRYIPEDSTLDELCFYYNCGVKEIYVITHLRLINGNQRKNRVHIKELNDMDPFSRTRPFCNLSAFST